jgi:hypothetical protein
MHASNLAVAAHPETAQETYDALCVAKTDSAVNYILRGACWLAPTERHEFAAKKLADTPKVRDKFLGFFEEYLSKGVTAENIDKRHFGCYVEICAVVGPESFVKAKAVVERAYRSVGRATPVWLKKRIDDMWVVYFQQEKTTHHGPSAKQSQKKAARAASDRAVRNAMKGKGGGGSQPQSGKGKKGKK